MRRQHKSAFPDLLHQSSGVPTAGKKAFRRIHLQRNFEDTPGNEYDPAVQRQRLHSFLQTTKLTDALHTAFGFRTDYEFISKADMRTIIKETKQK